MSEWKEYRFSELLVDESISYGIVQPGFHKEHDSIPIIRVNNIKNGKIITNDILKVDKSIESKYQRTRLQGGELLITVVGSVGECAIVPHNLKGWNVARAVSVARIKENFDKQFIKYVFKTDDLIFQMYGNTNDTVQPTLNLTELKALVLRVPSLSEQKAIASILSSLDDKIDLLHRQNATLEKMAETLFRQWFVEVHDAEDSFVHGTFSTWISETVGGEWGKETIENEYIKAVNCIRGTDIADLNTGLPDRSPVRFIKDKKFSVIEPKEGDLIIEISGGTEDQSTGRICYINEQIKKLFDYPLVFSNFCRLLRVKKAEYSFFIYCYIQYLYNQDEFFNLENGSSGIKNLDYKALIFELEYRMPTSDKLIIKFHEQVTPLFSKINQNKLQIRTLTSLRDTLLPKLMTGEIKV